MVPFERTEYPDIALASFDRLVQPDFDERAEISFEMLRLLESPFYPGGRDFEDIRALYDIELISGDRSPCLRLHWSI